jgi:hypothetical protein
MIHQKPSFARSIPTLLILLMSLGLVSGCRSPKPADPDAARKTLQAAFDAWKDGKPQESYVRSSSVHVADDRWAGGYKLLDYDITAGEEVNGYDLNFRVTLRLEDPKGKALKETASYKVAMSPKRVILRNEDF